MRSAYVLVDDSVVSRLELGQDSVSIMSRAYFGGGLWLLRVLSDRIPLNSAALLELITCDHNGPLDARFKPWAEL